MAAFTSALYLGLAHGSATLRPWPPLTTSQVDLLKADNVASGTLPGFRELNIQPEKVEDVVPTYIGVARKRSGQK